MQLTEDQIAKYRKIYLERFGDEISKDDALAQGLALIRFVRVLKITNEKNDESAGSKKDL